jgi:hypothetical protein
MRTRTYVVGMIVGLAAAMALSSVASAAVTGLSIESSVTPSKGDKKIRRGVSTFFASNDTHAGDLLNQGGCTEPITSACRAYPPSVRSVLTFSKSLKFDPGNLPDCNLSQLVGKSSAGALAACPRSHIGEGTVTQLFSDGRTITGLITAFNGAPSGGNPSQYLHVDFPGVITKPILSSVIRGNVITTQIPPILGSVSERFALTTDKIVTGKRKNMRTGKVKKTFYAMASCSNPNYTTRQDVTYQDGTTLTATTPGRCKQTKRKKKR